MSMKLTVCISHNQNWSNESIVLDDEAIENVIQFYISNHKKYFRYASMESYCLYAGAYKGSGRSIHNFSTIKRSMAVAYKEIGGDRNDFTVDDAADLIGRSIHKHQRLWKMIRGRVKESANISGHAAEILQESIDDLKEQIVVLVERRNRYIAEITELTS